MTSAKKGVKFKARSGFCEISSTYESVSLLKKNNTTHGDKIKQKSESVFKIEKKLRKKKYIYKSRNSSAIIKFLIYTYLVKYISVEHSSLIFILHVLWLPLLKNHFKNITYYKEKKNNPGFLT